MDHVLLGITALEKQLHQNPRMGSQEMNALQEPTVVIIMVYLLYVIKSSLNSSLINFKLKIKIVFPDEGSRAPEPCPAGTFSPVAGLVSQDLCRPCIAGFHCETTGLQAPTAPCREGETRNSPIAQSYLINTKQTLHLFSLCTLSLCLFW